ncbi:gene transfer agent family protein [Limimaricola sp. G21655-S1]|uniref:gene transfer agent family protein n=1 Tax=Limimaricola sp. G21655-S1 TaxID=3014768 RepID=UPI0022AEF081|nr:gene transfer agent family protein [Limimaricola sp. G21655-S1]MCZ4261125.1 gene transfer agent family protein [Limimaricola sp. G21655-S1]
MANPRAGEVALILDGRRHVMKLSLGALAELEESLGADSIAALVARLEGGEVSARDVMALIVAGLRGGGWPGRAADLVAAEIEGGPVEAARLAALLVARAFGEIG